MNKFYITSSLPYTNSYPHIGFALEIIQTDVLARYRRQRGEDVFFLTGTDEHGIKVARTAQETGASPQEFTDQISDRFHELTKALNISNNDFIRTTDQKRHWPSVREVWGRLAENGDLEKRTYEGLYCAGCEAFITEKELVNGQCLIHQKKPEKVQEENWFFKLSKYAGQLKEKIETDELRIVPEGRKKEILTL
ncbi:MAG: class I tRNA ligase family protein, partial [bacterium]|nr:class I tRNA ligase family protein [bacterium]